MHAVLSYLGDTDFRFLKTNEWQIVFFILDHSKLNYRYVSTNHDIAEISFRLLSVGKPKLCMITY